MKRYIKLSLLLLIPLFAKNVYAKELIDDKILPQVEVVESIETIKDEFIESNDDINEEVIEDKNINENDIETNNDIKDEEEIIKDNEVSNDDIKTGTSEDTNVISIENVLESIDNLYEIDLNETDNFTSKVKDLLRQIINNKLNNLNYDLESLGYNYELIWNYLENNKVDSYTLVLSDNNKKISKELTIKYSNSLNKNELDSNKIEEFLNENDLNLNKEYTLDEVLSNNTINLNTHLNNKLNNTGINYFILNNEITENLQLSNSTNKKVILSINEIIYKTINVEDKYTTIVEVPIEENKTSFIESTIKDKLTEYKFITNETIKYNLEENEIYIVNNDTELLLGSITIKEIKKDYIITTGANSTIKESENLRIGLVSDINEFKRIEVNNVELNPNYYSINNTEIVINNEFIKSLNKGTYTLTVIYKTGRANTTFNIISTPVVEYKPVVRPNYPSRPNYIVNNYQNNNNNITNDDNDNDDEIKIDEDENTQDDEEENDKEKEELDDEKDIDLGAILEDKEDNNTNEKSENKIKDKETKTGFLAMIKSRALPIIIVTVVIIIGGITIYVFFKAKEEHIL